MSGVSMRNRTQDFMAFVLVLTAITAPSQHSFSQGRADESPFASAETMPAGRAQCHEIKDLIRNVPTPEGLERIDFAAVGPLSLVQFDGVLAYMGICSEPDAKVLCVTYSTNDMKIGDIVNVTGSYRKMAPNYVVLDPCLAMRPDPDLE